MSSSSVQETMTAQLSDKTIFQQAKRYAYAYMDAISERRVFPDEKAIANLAAFDEPLPRLPQSGADTLAMLNEFGSPATVAQTGARYFGFVNGNAVPTGLAARWLADVWDQNAALHVMSPVVAKLEQLCEQWMCQLLGLPDDTVAGLVGGTSIATMCGLAAGRYALLTRLGWDVNSEGLFDAPPLRVVVSEQAHGTVFKALALLGLGNRRVELVPADSEGRMDVTQLPELDASTLLILQAGNVNTGSFDEFDLICDLAQAAGAWVHIDGAFGLWAAASPKFSHLTSGIEKADSWSVDGHKTLNTPYDCGIVLCKNRDALVASMQTTGAYIEYGEARDSMLYTPDMSRRARAVELWATLRFLGRAGVAELIEGLCAGASQFADLLAREGFTILNDVVFNQVLVACETPDATRLTLANMQASGECWCGGTTWRGAPAIRISVCSWATTADDVDRSVQAFVDARGAMQREFYPADVAAPGGVRTDRLLLRPLRATDVELDYDAVMSSADQLHRWSQTDWPTNDFTPAENLADLERHEREHLAREAFTYTVLNPAGTRCLGCVYITPLNDDTHALLCADATYVANVGFWVRSREIVNELDQHLLDALRTWLADEWAFDCVVFLNSLQDDRQAEILSVSGLKQQAPITLAGGRRCRAFIMSDIVGALNRNE